MTGVLRGWLPWGLGRGEHTPPVTMMGSLSHRRSPVAPEFTRSTGRALFFALSYSSPIKGQGKCLTVENSQAVHRAGEYACYRMEARDLLQGRSRDFQLAQMPAFILKVIKQSKMANTSTSEHFT